MQASPAGKPAYFLFGRREVKKIFFLASFLALLLLFGGCFLGGAPVNSKPYPVIAPFASKQYAEDSGNQTFQLLIDEQDGKKDPEGDEVYFRFSPMGTGWVTVDENTGIVTIDTVDSHGAQDFQFWSEDARGADTQDSAVTVTLSVVFS